MTAVTINRAANDPDLRARVTAMAHKEMMFNETLADSQYGVRLRSGMTDVTALMYPIAVDTEAAYETAVNAGRGAPGHDMDVIPDAALTSAINAHWPWAEGEEPTPP
jgi:hypothetical protein